MFVDVCKKREIRRQRGDGERWSTVVDKMKKMLQDKLVPDEFWAEVMNTTIYWLNRSSNKVMI